MATVVLLGTCDTKLEELLFLRQKIEECPLAGADGDITHAKVHMVDVGRSPILHDAITVSQTDLISRYGNGKTSVADLPRNEVIKTMSDCATQAVQELFRTGTIHGIISAGGSGGTSLAAAVMRNALPIGFPKLIVSTIASGDTGPIVGETDITMMYSVVDVAGLNQVLRDILSNAGAAIAAAASRYAVRHRQPPPPLRQGRATRVGITMFGVTTPGVDAIRRHLGTEDIETYVFHATGHGGKAMERLVREGQLDGVIDLTTTEITDYVTGGVMSAGPDRLRAAALAGIPNIVSLGATDMTNFGPRETVPERYARDEARKMYEHNAVVTLMRSSKDECRAIGEFVCTRLKEAAKRPDVIELWIPGGGVSMLSTPGGPFEDCEADRVLFDAVRDGLAGTGIRVVEDARHVNDEGFAKDISEAFLRLLRKTQETGVASE